MAAEAACSAGRRDRCFALTRCLEAASAMARPLAVCVCSRNRLQAVQKANVASVEHHSSGDESHKGLESSREETHRVQESDQLRTRYTMSDDTANDALLQLARTRSLDGKKVCALNFANGEDAGGLCLHGVQGQKPERRGQFSTLFTPLCHMRRQSNAHLRGARTSHPACSAVQDWQRYAEVLFTPRLSARRGSRAGCDKSASPPQVKNSMALVSAAAPNLPKGFALFCNHLPAPTLSEGEEFCRDHLLETIRTIIATPRLKDRSIDTLVLGARFCGNCGCDPAVVAALFAQVLHGEGIGRLYREVHFAVPSRSGASAEAFKMALGASGLLLESARSGPP